MRFSRKHLGIWCAGELNFGRAAACVGLRAAIILIAAHVFGAALLAQKLALPHYDVSDGLVSSNIHSIYQDRRGFLWFGTNDGLSRFDGYRFVNYGRRDGLPNTDINCVVEDQQGRIWIATNGGGIARLMDSPDRKTPTNLEKKPADPNAKFINFPVGKSAPSNRVNSMLFDSRGRLWCLTDAGLYVSESINSNNNEPSFESFSTSDRECQGAFEDESGHLWFGLGNELIEVDERRVIHHGFLDSHGNTEFLRNEIIGIVKESSGKMLVAGAIGLYEFTPPSAPSPNGAWRKLPLRLSRSQFIQAILLEKSGVVWLGTSSGLIKYQAGRQTEFAAAQGLSVDYVRSLYADRNENMWIASGGGGVYKLPRDTIVSYTQETGLPHPFASGVLQDSTGSIFAVYTYSPAELVELNPEGIRRHREMPFLPATGSSVLLGRREGERGWNVLLPFTAGFIIQQPAMQLRNGHTVNLSGLLSGLSRSGVCIYEDDSGGLWFASDDKNIRRTEANNPNFGNAKTFPADFVLTQWGGYPLMITDHAGGLWLGGVGRLGRLWHGQFQSVPPSAALPVISPLSFYLDRRGWLWIGTRSGGVAATEEPGIEHPKFVSYSPDQTFSNSSVYSITEDEFGRMYFATSRGLDRFDPKTNEWRHFTAKDGLAGNRIFQVVRDRSGNIWVATSAGVSRIDPKAQPAGDSAAPIYFSRINVAGDDLPLPELGANRIPKLELPSARNNMTFEFFGLQFKGEDYLRYQYRLENADKDWSPPAKNRSVTYARLAPGDYRFAVRAVTEAGIVSSDPAEISFRILPPVWRRSWLLAALIFAFLLAIYAAYRYRIGRVIELERVRMRIATDLHDDIGANLSLIAMVSDIARSGVRPADSQIAGRLALIANTSRATMDSMGDIVWAVNPNKDQVGDLTQRMRRVADNVFTTNNIEFALHAPDEENDRAIGSDTRREIFMIFKEAVNNIARHSNCTRAEIEFAIEGARLQMKLSDDGGGFDVANNSSGNGLASMRRRAANLGGTLEIVSERGAGTTIVLTAPISGTAHVHAAG